MSLLTSGHVQEWHPELGKSVLMKKFALSFSTTKPRGMCLQDKKHSTVLAVKLRAMTCLTALLAFALHSFLEKTDDSHQAAV